MRKRQSKKLLLAALLVLAGLFLLQHSYVNDSVSPPEPPEKNKTSPTVPNVGTVPSKTLGEFLQQLEAVKQNDPHLPSADSPSSNEHTAEKMQEIGEVIDAASEENSAAAVSEPISIGEFIDPEHDDPNKGVPESAPLSIGEFIDPETYVAPADPNEKEINIGPFIPLPTQDDAVAEDEQTTPIEIGPVRDVIEE